MSDYKTGYKRGNRAALQEVYDIILGMDEETYTDGQVLDKVLTHIECELNLKEES